MTENKLGAHIANLAKQTYGTTTPTTAQLGYLLDHMQASTYLLKHHTIRGHPITFYIRGRDMAKAHSHRPWQVQMVNDTHQRRAIIKSRQLGLSELGVGGLLHFADTHSYDKVKGLYTFPTHSQVKRFVQTRLDPLLERGYYSQIIDPKINSLEAKRIRDSVVYFRTSSKPSAVEGEYLRPLAG